jgi:uncharacterized protein (TIGR03790 family)
MRRLLAPSLALGLAACGGGGGGGAGQDGTSADTSPLPASALAVLVAEGDPTSEAIARAYQQARGVPEANIIRLPVDIRSDTLSAADFGALKASLDARLPAGVQATLLTWTRPSRVEGACVMSITSALAFGYDTRWCGNGCVATAASPYYGSASHRPFSDLGLRPSMMLGAQTLAEAQTLIARGVAADGLLSSGRATGQAWLVRSSDSARSVRFSDFLSLAASSVPGLVMRYVDNAAGTGSDLVVNQANVMFYITGLATVPQADSNSWLPGAAADHLTSFGGVLPDGNGQMPATAWLRAGATASYGAVDEPCNYAEKFPRASVLVGRYQAGDTLLEAYWKSVRWPGQGLFLGEPLARPWAR